MAVNWRMDYVATMSFVDVEGEAIQTRRYHLAHDEPGERIAKKIMFDLAGSAELVPLRGGCDGGLICSPNILCGCFPSDTPAAVGGGGGALRISSNTRIEVGAIGFTGAIALPGGGAIGGCGVNGAPAVVLAAQLCLKPLSSRCRGLLYPTAAVAPVSTRGDPRTEQWLFTLIRFVAPTLAACFTWFSHRYGGSIDSQGNRDGPFGNTFLAANNLFNPGPLPRSLGRDRLCFSLERCPRRKTSMRQFHVFEVAAERPLRITKRYTLGKQRR